MNPMTNIKNIKKLSEEDLKGRNKTSWHEQYRGSAWIFVGGLPYDLTEGDIICVFSQYGEPLNLNLVRDKDTGKSKGFCFICYEDQRSTDLAVDNLNGIKILGRTLRVDHVEKYKPPKEVKDEPLKNTPKIPKEKLNQDDDGAGSNVKEYEPQKTNEEKRKRRSDHASKKSSNKKTSHKTKKKRKKQDALSDVELRSKKRKKMKPRGKSPGSESSISTSSLSPSSSSSSSSSLSPSSSSSASSSESDFNCHKKHKRSMSHKNLKQKKSRTIEDLKREARLIQAELKRRQKIDEQREKSSGKSSEKQQSKRDGRKSRFRRSLEEGNRRSDSKDRIREGRHQRTDDYKDRRRDNLNSLSRRVSRSPKTISENDHRHQYR